MIDAFIETCERRGFSKSDLYIGIAADVEKQLFKLHHVNRDDEEMWIWCEAATQFVACYVERHYETSGIDGKWTQRNRWKRVDEEYRAAGCDGLSAIEERSGKFVYAFAKADHTIPDLGDSWNHFSDYSDRG